MEHYIYGFIMGMVQGLTEFLPVSSSGHLFAAQFLAQKFFPNTDTPFADGALPLLYVVLLHAATLCAVLIFTRRTVADILVSCVQSVCSYIFGGGPVSLRDNAYCNLMWMVVVASAVTMPLGLLFKSFVEDISLLIVLGGFCITVIVLVLPSIVTSRTGIKQHSVPQNTELATATGVVNVTVLQAVLIGLAQGFAVFPGISRSGITIVVAVLLGLSLADAAHFSFLLAIPAIIASFVAGVLDAEKISSAALPVGMSVISMISAFVFGFIGLRFLTTVVRHNKLWMFAIYVGCVIAVLVGVSALV